jgi:TRAP-type transport system periplasmic protein
VQMIAKEAQAANVSLTVQVYPGASLFKPNQQWNALVDGQLDISLFPLDYASGKVPAFSATLMPGLIRSQDRAKRVNGSPFMTDVRAEIVDNGVIVLSDAWFAGGMAAKDHCIVKPDDLKGMKFRAAGPTFAAMWEAAGASIVSPPSNEIYNAFQTGVVNATDTSLGTFDSTRLYEVTDCLTAPGNNALWFMYEPVLMSKKSFDKLNKAQQDVFIKAGKDAQAYFEGKADAVNQEAIKDFEDHKVKVVTLSDADYNTWLDLAKKSSYAKFAKDVPNGQKLIDEALAVK